MASLSESAEISDMNDVTDVINCSISEGASWVKVPEKNLLHGDKNTTSSEVDIQWENVVQRMKEFENYMSELDAKMEQKIQELGNTSIELKTTVEQQKNDVEQAENVSQTLFLFYQENSEEIKNLQLGFHEMGNKSLEKDKNIEEKFETIRQEQAQKYEQIQSELREKISTLENEVQKLKGKQENVILDAMRSTLECMMCLELPRLPLYVCPSCSKMIGCFNCCKTLTTCANCRAILPTNHQPLRGLEVLGLLLPTSDVQ